MTRNLYGASTADFAATVKSITTTTDGVVNNLVQITPGAVFDVFDAPNGVVIGDLLTANADLSEGAAATQVTALSNGTLPYFGPDDDQSTHYLKVDDGLGGFIWYPLNPSKIGDIVADLQTQVDAIGPGGGSTFSGDYADLTNVPPAFNPTLHNHPAAQISDSTTVGRAVLTALDQQAARAAIGAGTGNGTSNLVIGTSASTAAAGNHTHQAGNLAATPFTGVNGTDVQTQLQQVYAAAGGTITGSSSILMWQYASGAWPALPATKPAGVLTVWGQGPNLSTGTLPSWVGLGGAGAGQATLAIDIVGLS